MEPRDDYFYFNIFIVLVSIVIFLFYLFPILYFIATGDFKSLISFIALVGKKPLHISVV